MRRYLAKRVVVPVPLTGQVAGTPWEWAVVLKIEEYPWYADGLKQATKVRVLYDESALYLQYHCLDRHLYSRATHLNGEVWLDSCVEFFASPVPESGPDYFNLEMNCCGTFLAQFGPNRQGRTWISEALAREFTVAVSEPGPCRDESPADERWWVAARLPFDTLSRFVGRQVRPESGARWRANFYRCGGQTDPQYACWNRVEAPQPDYHRPECFGELVFE